MSGMAGTNETRLLDDYPISDVIIFIGPCGQKPHRLYW